MTQFKYLNEMNSLLNSNTPLKMGPKPRWEKKAAEIGSVNTGMNNSTAANKSVSSANNSVSSRTSSANNSISSKTPSKKHGDVVTRNPSKTPSKTPKSKSPSRTPGVNNKTPTSDDRFIPHRGGTNFELSHYKLNQQEIDPDNPIQGELQRAMCENLHGTDISQQRILSYQKKAPTAPMGFQNPMKVVYTQAKTPGSIKSVNRYIPHQPDRVLDAPDIVDDYYLNLLDWSCNNVLAAALGGHIYLWDAGTGSISQLLELSSLQDYVSSVSWIAAGDYLAVGMTNGKIELWDANNKKLMRTMNGHASRIGAMTWNSYVLTTGCREGKLIHHDVRVREHIIGSYIQGHTHEICGLKWSPDGRYLASGGNDNLLNIWPGVSGGYHAASTPLYQFTAHQAAVKALAWCPWQPHVLASGGGTADRHIRFWSCTTGACLNSIDTKSQVCGLLWSKEYKELISGHGYANNQLIIWKYPSMTKVAELTGHTARILHLVMSPDGTTVLSAGADETLRLWKCFEEKKNKKKGNAQKTVQSALLNQHIR